MITLSFEIFSTELDVRSGISQKTGNSYSFSTQVAFIHFSDEPYPLRSTVTLDTNQSAYAPGLYTAVYRISLDRYDRPILELTSFLPDKK